MDPTESVLGQNGSTVVYVSSSSGNDANSGLTEQAPKRTLTAAVALLRNGYPDWLLLKRGDVWDHTPGSVFPGFHPSLAFSGRSNQEPFVIGTYGQGPRPLLRTGTYGLSFNLKDHIAIIGLEIWAHEYTGSEANPAGLSFMNSSDILVEDTLIRGFHGGVAIQGFSTTGSARVSDVRFRRNLVLDNFTQLASHAVGLYVDNTDRLLLEENVFDHNGWSSTVPGANPTQFRRNTYVQYNCSDVIFSGNISARSSSDALQLRPGGWAINNLFLLNGGLSALLSRPAGVPPSAIQRAEWNVIIGARDINPSHPHGWGMRIEGAHDMLVANNIIKDANLPTVDSLIGLAITGSANNTRVFRNKIFNWFHPNAAPGARALDLETSTNTSVVENEITMPQGGQVVRISNGATSFGFSRNQYHGTEANPFQVLPWTFATYAGWLAWSNEQQSVWSDPTYIDPNRNAATYMRDLGYPVGQQSLEGFLTEVRRQAKGYWRPAFTAESFNAYIRSGFGKRP